MVNVRLGAGEPNETVLFIETASDVSAKRAEIFSIGLDLGLEWLALCGGDHERRLHSIASQRTSLLSSCHAHHDAV